MTIPAVPSAEVAPSAADLQRQVRARIASLSYLPTTAAVAIKFVELGKNPEAEPADYAKVISADSSLSSKLLALANSSWAGIRTKVTNVRMAVNLLGLGTVRTLAISYCMTGLHNELRLSPAESETFWESSLSKAVAAKQYATMFDPKLGDEAFVAGLFQDFAIAVMYSAARERYLRLLEDPQSSVQAQLERERELFGMDHTEVGRFLAHKLELPELFVDTVAFHHNYERLTEFVSSAPLRDATYAAGWLPHTPRAWNTQDADALAAFLGQQAPSTDLKTYLEQVQTEFGQLYAFFNEGKTPQAQLTDLLTHTAREIADNTTVLVETVHELLQEAAAAGVQVSKRVKQLEDEANCDPLTGALNRQGFAAAAEDVLAKAARYGIGFAVCYLDLDKFKAVNDDLGHAFGDYVLQKLVAEATAALPDEALIGRVGGDEFVLLINSCSRAEAVEMVERIVSSLGSKPTRTSNLSRVVTLSAGLLYVKPCNQIQSLDALISAADKLMYAAKRAGGNCVEVRVI